jgi:hypothetical protein
LFSLDDPEHSDPKFGARPFPAERFVAGVISRYGRSFRPVHRDHIPGERYFCGATAC